MINRHKVPNDPHLIIGLVPVTNPQGVTDLMDRQVGFDADPTPFPSIQCPRVPHGIGVKPIHMSIHGNNLHTTTKDPTAQSDLPYMVRRSLRSWDPSLYKEVPPVSRDSS